MSENLTTNEGPNYLTSKGFSLTAAVWMIVATLVGLTAAIELVAPDLAGNVAWLLFSRLRPMHVNLVLFGFVVPGLLAAVFYMFPRLLNTPIFSDKLGFVTVVIWNIMLVAVVVTLGMGITQGREYAELVWPIDLMVVGAFVLIFINLIMTVHRRQEKILYASIWYALAAIVLTAVTYSLGNVIWRPHTGALMGIPDAIMLWFYGHNIFGLLLTPLSIAVAYYIVPQVCRSPLFSHTLSLLGFWSILVIYTHIGTHHLLQVPVPTWLKVVAIVDSVAMVIPVMAFLINIWYTIRGKLSLIQADIGGKFVLIGTIMYFIVSIRGSMMSLPDVQRVTHFSHWVVGHAHVGVLGFAGMISLGGVYFILPRITGKPLFSPFLANLHYWLVLIGITGFAIILTISGLIQGHAWLNGETVYRVLPQIHIYNVIRASFGVLIFVSSLLGFYNITRSIFFNYGERP